jgi:hypothetical protein
MKPKHNLVIPLLLIGDGLFYGVLTLALLYWKS